MNCYDYCGTYSAEVTRKCSEHVTNRPARPQLASDIGEGGSKEMKTHVEWAAIPVRLIVGYGFMAHGYAKLVRGPDSFAGILHLLGVPAPELMGWATVLVELACGLAVLIGAFVTLASVPMAVVL